MRELCYIHSGKSVTVKTVLQNHFCLSRASVSALKNSGGISVNGENVTVRRELSEGDRLTLKFFDKPCEIIPTNMDIDILYEDEDILAVNKPCGIPTHPSRGHYTDTLANGICYYYRNENFVFRAVNRLDRETSGIVVIAKNKNSAHKLGEQIKKNAVKKVYYAVITGEPNEKSGEINAPIARIDGMKRGVRNDGKYALTKYKVIASDGGHTLLEIMPVTGRTHQIRVHLSHIGCPILGDSLYGNGKDRLYLHCGKMTFSHPVSGEIITLNCPPKNWFRLYIQNTYNKKIQEN